MENRTANVYGPYNTPAKPHQITIKNHKCKRKTKPTHAKYKLTHISRAHAWLHGHIRNIHAFMSESMNAIVTWIDFDAQLTWVRFCEWS